MVGSCESLDCVKGGAFMNYLDDYYSMNVDCVSVRILFVCSWAEENEPKSQQSQPSVVRSDSHDTTMMIMERDVSELHCLFKVAYVRILTRLFLSLFSLLVVKKLSIPTKLPSMIYLLLLATLFTLCGLIDMVSILLYSPNFCF